MPAKTRAWIALVPVVGVAIAALCCYSGRTHGDEATATPPRDKKHASAIPQQWVESPVEPCQALGPAAPYNIYGVDCATGTCGERGWNAMGPIPWQAYAQGEYVGHERTAHVPVYFLRVDDLIDVIYRLTREESGEPYELQVGDDINVESLTDPNLDRNLIVQPDGTITLRLLGQVRATRRSIAELTEHLKERYQEFYKPGFTLTVTPLRVNTRLEDLRATVDARAGSGGQRLQVRVSPDGTIQLPALGSVPAQGLTLEQLKREIDERYERVVPGIEVTPVLADRAPRFIYVLGEVAVPGRYALEGPTTAMQAIALAGSWNVGANTRQIVVFRRGDDWRLMATMLDLRGALYGKSPCPADEIWLNDSDTIVVPKSPILVADEFIELVFTRGIYGVVPFNVGYTFTNLSAL